MFKVQGFNVVQIVQSCSSVQMGFSYFLFSIFYSLFIIRYSLMVNGYWLLVIGCWLRPNL